MIDDFTICVLLYGNHFDLALRCLTPLLQGGPIPASHLRIGLNAVCPQTRELAYQAAPGYVWEFEENQHKYPVMRQMIHGISPICTPYTMWFDDDSYIVQPLAPWLTTVASRMTNADLIGSLYFVSWQGQQRAFVKAQPWYKGKDPAARGHINFATGGWWTIRTDVLYKFNYPWPELDHRGGDAMLGEMCFQQGLRLKHFRDNVKINASSTGKESAAPRRGFNQDPLGFDFDPGVAEALHRATSPPATGPEPTKRRRIVEL